MQFNGFCSSPPTMMMMMMICRCRERWQQQQNLIIQSNFAGKQKKIYFILSNFQFTTSNQIYIYHDGDDDENVSHLQKKKLNSSN